MTTRRELVEAYGQWLQGYRWDLFATLTFAGYPSTTKANRLFDKWISEVEKVGGTKTFRYVRVTERGANADNVHFHVLLGGMKRADWRFPFKWAARWRELAADAVIQRFDPNQGGVYYLLKTLLPDSDFAITLYFRERGVPSESSGR